MLARLVTLPPGASPPISTRQTRVPPAFTGRSVTLVENVDTEPPVNFTSAGRYDVS